MKNVFLGMLAVLVILQFIPAKIENYPVDRNLEIKLPDDIMKIFKKACYDCHSNEVVIPWYQSIAPMSFKIKHHVDLGRKWLNFSEWENYTSEEKDKKLEGIFRTVYAAMPLESYIWLHPEAELTKEEINRVRDWTGKAPF
ncbi:MAG: heme-binding domain-containing protein [Campylobacterota bacterium]|nr:heme-binding domain-containing protein [Campylobacterota bacterium]